MTYTPGVMPVPRMIGTFTASMTWGGWQNSSASSGTGQGAEVAHYYPILIPATCVVRRVWWANGSSVSATYNIDCGLYADGGYKPGPLAVSSGATAQGTAAQVQFADVTDTTIGPGLYWIGLVCSSSSATFMRLLLSDFVDAPIQFRQSSSAYPLPATATPVEAASDNIVLCGFATTASP